MPEIPRNADYTKEYNRKLFLRILRTLPSTRIRIAKQMGLSRTAVSLITDELLADDIIEETTEAPNEESRKKNAVYLRLKKNRLFAVGVYLNRDGCSAGIIDICGDVYAQRRLQLSGFRISEKLDPLADAIEKMLGEAGIDKSKLIGIGVSAPGPLDGKNGRILNPPRFDFWHNTDISAYLQGRLHVPAFLENNTSCLARYNYKKTGMGGSDDYMVLLVDSGVGAGIVTGGHVLLSLGESACEFGHISIDYRGKKCTCGNVGCLESYAAIPSLLKGTSFETWQQVIDSTTEEAAEIIRRECTYLSTGIVTMANIINIDTVLLAGDLLYGTERIMFAIEEMVNSRAIRRNIQKIKVLPAYSDLDMEIKAAADIAFGRFLMI